MSDPWVSQWRKGFVEFCVLAVVRGGAAYGYAILKTLNETEVLAFTESTVYPALNRMTKEGLLSSYKQASPDGPPRRYYTLTPAGRHRLAEMTVYWTALKDGLDRVLTQTDEGKT